jgi:AraC-like DNA-binding protein
MASIVGVGGLARTAFKPVDQHLARVSAVIDGNGSAVQGAISASWKRSANNFGIDPTSDEPPRILTPAELRDYREKVERLIGAAGEELDNLYRVVSRARYVVLLTNELGVAIDHRGNQAEAAEFASWGIWLGGVWSEAAEGTNGIGTSIAEQRPITVHQTEHFRARHISLSCSVAPIFGGDGELIGGLDVSSIDPGLSEHSHALAGSLVVEAARAIEERYFRELFRRSWIVAAPVADGTGGAMLLALGRDQQIVGADRNARAALLQAGGTSGIGSVDFWTLFERDERIFRRSEVVGDLRVLLTRVGGTEPTAALITVPEASAAVWRNPEVARLHSRPRINLLASMPPTAEVHHSTGGLPPRTLRRVQEYVEAHLNESIELEELAAIAGLSMYHFARAFKTSAGVPPHSYLLRQRVDRARDLLISTEIPVADIAIATGFADQSHLARHFRQYIGVSPGAFRRSNR